MKTITEQTSGCIQFEQIFKQQSKDHIRFYSDNKGCFTFLGAQEGQPLSLPDRCRKKHIIIHEIVHTLGFETFKFKIIFTCFI
jgi:Zn-dependent peptidase ImmA (M78 family)